ncbi:MAG: adenosine kinase [Lentisphaeria bacterium]|nr:adenosine kinase [Lentisphaeria bacterium]
MSCDHCKVLGFGSPILDMLAQVDDSFLSAHVEGEKGGMVMLDTAAQGKLLDALSGSSITSAIGGSAFNTISALTALQMPTAFLGKIGKDERGEYFSSAYTEKGGDASRLLCGSEEPTATCISLVTPDSERTMRSHLGAASTVTADEITDQAFEGITHFHAEGYTLFLPGCLRKSLELARKHGCTTSLDLASFEVVRLFRSEILDMLKNGLLDIVFANEDEAREFCGDRIEFTPENVASFLLQYCKVAAVKLGKKGAVICEGSEKAEISPRLVKAIDTTGAGDLWQAGFLYGYLSGCGIAKAGEMGSVLGAEIVQVLGAQIPAGRWDFIQSEFNKIKG